MREKIIILEDEFEREAAMKVLLSNAYPNFEIHFFDSSLSMIDYLSHHLSEARIISLDHDLPLYRNSEGELIDHGNGREVADYLAGQSPSCTIGIHSTNVPAAIGMEIELSDSGWETFRITPYGDLGWIEELWFPLMRKSLN